MNAQNVTQAGLTAPDAAKCPRCPPNLRTRINSAEGHRRALTQALVQQTAGWLVTDLTDQQGHTSEYYVSQAHTTWHTPSRSNDPASIWKKGPLHDRAHLSKRLVSRRYRVTAE